MTSSSSNSTDYHQVQPTTKSQHATEQCEVREPGRSSKVSWRAPITILLALLTGLGFALAHHFMGVSLDNKPVAQVSIPQAWISRFSTALAFLVKLALATSVGAAYTQHQWQRLRQQDFRTSDIDALTSVLANAFSFLSSTVWLKHPVLALMASVSWSIPIAAIIAPGSLTVFPQSTNDTVSLPVRQLDFNYTNFGTFVGGGSYHLLSYPRIYNLAFRTASTGETIELNSPGHYQNASYHLDFSGPAIKCAPADDEVLNNLTYRYGVGSGRMIVTRFFSWVPTLSLDPEPSEDSTASLDLASEDAARIFVLTNEGDWNVSRTYNGSDTRRYMQVNVTECLLYNATYDVDYRFQYPSQTRNASVSDWLNPVAMLSREDQKGIYDENATTHQILSYAAVMDAFGQLLVGQAKKDKYAVETVTSTIWKLSPFNWEDGPSVAEGLEQLFQNITLSLLSDDALIKNGTLANLVPVTVNNWPVTYVYTASGLIVAYGVAFLCALGCSAVGLYAFYVNNASYQNLFSTYIRATVDSAIRLQTRSGDDGADPLPKALAKFYVTIGGHRDNSDEHYECNNHQDVELRRLNVAEINPSLELSWDHLNNAHDPSSTLDHCSGSLEAEERSQTEAETRSIVSSIDHITRDDPNVRSENMEGDRRH